MEQFIQANIEKFSLAFDIINNNEKLLKSLVKTMPKGSILHSHYVAGVNWDNYFGKIINHEINKTHHVYVQIVEDTEIGYKSKLGDFAVFPVNINKNLDDWIEITNDNYLEYSTNISKFKDWEQLRDAQRSVWRLVRYEGYYQIFFETLLEESILDNVQHVELKTTLGNLYTINNEGVPTILNEEYEVSTLNDIYDKFKDKDQLTFALIPGCSRRIKPSEATKKFDKIIELYKKNKNIIRGIDLFGIEHTGFPNCAYSAIIKNIIDNNTIDSDFVIALHSGERTKNEEQTIIGMDDFPACLEYKNKSVETDNNIDYILNLPQDRKFRIGHGLSLIMYPDLMEKIKKQKNIHIEICPISNKILGYFDKIEENPGLFYYKNGISISISPDDMSFYGSDGSSSDWCEIIPKWKLNLKDIYKICMNSINFSAIDKNSRNKITDIFEKKFKNFVEKVVEESIFYPDEGGNNIRKGKNNKKKKYTNKKRKFTNKKKKYTNKKRKYTNKKKKYTNKK